MAPNVDVSEAIVPPLITSMNPSRVRPASCGPASAGSPPLPSNWAVLKTAPAAGSTGTVHVNAGVRSIARPSALFVTAPTQVSLAGRYRSKSSTGRLL